MLKKVFLLLLIAIFTTPVMAGNSLRIKLKNAEDVVCAFSSKPVVTYKQDNLIMTSTDGEVMIPFTEISSIVYEKVSTDVETPLRDFSINYSNGKITLSGLSDGEVVRFYTVSGVLLAEETVVSNTISAEILSMNADIIVVKTSKLSFKVRCN